jgi:ferrochelatase
MFPQFSCSTTGSLYDAATRAALGRRCPWFFGHQRRMPALRFVPPYYDHPAYIQALSSTIQEELARLGRKPDHYLLSFHGIPCRYADQGDPYRQHCETTSRLLARALGLRQGEWSMGFQSRFGKEPWLEPYTGDLLRRLGKEGVSTLLATCPGFTADCLETLDEIGREGAHQFRAAGGAEFCLVPCLNAHPAWLAALAAMARQELAGWLDGA